MDTVKGDIMQTQRSIILSVLLLGALPGYIIASPAHTGMGTYKHVMVMERGTERPFYFKETDERNESAAPHALQRKRFNVYSSQMLEAKKGVLIHFKKGAKVDIGALEATYGLKLKEKLKSGYYIFDNLSAYSDVELIHTIMKNERKNISTVKPNWPKQNQPR